MRSVAGGPERSQAAADGGRSLTGCTVVAAQGREVSVTLVPFPNARQLHRVGVNEPADRGRVGFKQVLLQRALF